MQKAPPSIDHFDRIAKRGSIGYYKTPQQWRFEFWFRVAATCVFALVVYGAWRLAPIIGFP